MAATKTTPAVRLHVITGGHHLPCMWYRNREIPRLAQETFSSLHLFFFLLFFFFRQGVLESFCKRTIACVLFAATSS